MRSGGVGWLVILLAALVAAATVPVIPVRAAPPAPIVPGVSLADIPLGSPIREVVSRLGAPTEVHPVGPNGTLAYVFGQYGITVYTQSDVVVALASTNSLLATVQGIGLGAPSTAITTAFGAPPALGVVEGFQGPAYPALGIAFGVDHQAVAAVMIFHPVVAAPATPSGPQAPSPTTSRSVDSSAPRSPTSETAPGAATVTTPRTAGGGAEPASAPSPAAPGPTTAPDPAGPSAPEAPTQGAPAGSAQGAAPTATAPAVLGSGPAASNHDAPTFTPAFVPLDLATPGTTPPASGQPGAVAAMMLPHVGNLEPFTAETRYLSLAGYLRYLVHNLTQTWVSPQESERLVHQRLGTLPR
jgi:hypothetical protein